MRWSVYLPATVAIFSVLLGAACAAAEDEAPPRAPALIAMGDFNRDGIPDLAEVPAGVGEPGAARFLTILLGRGDGTFRPAAAIPLPGRDPRSIAVGDFSGDGQTDVVIGDGGGSLVELLGDGRGNLAPPVEIARFDSVVSIAAGDFNRDGKLDLAVSDVHANRVTILLAEGHGAFRIEWSFPTPKQSAVFHLAAADFNGDGIPDLAVTDEEQDTFAVMLGNGSGTFTYAPALSKVIDPKAHCAT
jgi:hypothetical protein